MVTSSNAKAGDYSFFEPTNVIAAFSRTSRWRSGSVTYKITVLNNTNYKYTYAGIDYVRNASGYNGNSYISNGITITTKDNQNDSSATFNTNDFDRGSLGA